MFRVMQSANSQMRFGNYGSGAAFRQIMTYQLLIQSYGMAIEGYSRPSGILFISTA